MAKIITEVIDTVDAEGQKIINIQETQTLIDIDGNEVVIPGGLHQVSVATAIENCELHKAKLEAQLAACEVELAEMIAIRDAE